MIGGDALGIDVRVCSRTTSNITLSIWGLGMKILLGLITWHQNFFLNHDAESASRIGWYVIPFRISTLHQICEYWQLFFSFSSFFPILSKLLLLMLLLLRKRYRETSQWPFIPEDLTQEQMATVFTKIFSFFLPSFFLLFFNF